MKNDEKVLEKSGWKCVVNPITNDCEIIFPLKHLFGFNDYKEIMWKESLTIIFRGSSNNNEAFCKWGEAAELPRDSKIVIKTMEARMPVAEYETNHATLLKSNMVKNPIIPISFLNSQTIEKSVIGCNWKKCTI